MFCCVSDPSSSKPKKRSEKAQRNDHIASRIDTFVVPGPDQRLPPNHPHLASHQSRRSGRARDSEIVSMIRSDDDIGFDGRTIELEIAPHTVPPSVRRGPVPAFDAHPPPLPTHTRGGSLDAQGGSRPLPRPPSPTDPILGAGRRSRDRGPSPTPSDPFGAARVVAYHRPGNGTGAKKTTNTNRLHESRSQSSMQSSPSSPDHARVLNAQEEKRLMREREEREQRRGAPLNAKDEKRLLREREERDRHRPRTAPQQEQRRELPLSPPPPMSPLSPRHANSKDSVNGSSFSKEGSTASWRRSDIRPMAEAGPPPDVLPIPEDPLEDAHLSLLDGLSPMDPRHDPLAAAALLDRPGGHRISVLDPPRSLGYNTGRSYSTSSLVSATFAGTNTNTNGPGSAMGGNSSVGYTHSKSPSSPLSSTFGPVHGKSGYPPAPSSTVSVAPALPHLSPSSPLTLNGAGDWGAGTLNSAIAASALAAAAPGVPFHNGSDVGMGGGTLKKGFFDALINGPRHSASMGNLRAAQGSTSSLTRPPMQNRTSSFDPTPHPLFGSATVVPTQAPIMVGRLKVSTAGKSKNKKGRVAPTVDLVTGSVVREPPPRYEAG